MFCAVVCLLDCGYCWLVGCAVNSVGCFDSLSVWLIVALGELALRVVGYRLVLDCGRGNSVVLVLMDVPWC